MSRLSRFRAAPVVAALALIAALFVLLAGSSKASETTTRTLVDKQAVFATPRMPTGLDAKSATVVDAQTGRAYFAIDPRQRRLIASTTKIMTALIAISRTRPNQLLTSTGYRGSPGESMLGLKPGEKMSAQDLLRALLLVSANDAADTFAARTATSRTAFVDAMNRRARALGLTGTHYGNPIGLDVPRTYSTAQDLAKLTRAALEEPRFRNTVGKARAKLRSGDKPRSIVNRNELVGEYQYVDGVKTGHTTAAGYVLVGSAHKADASVISVVTGEPSIASRNSDSLKLLRFGRGFYRVVAPVKRKVPVAKLPIALQDGTADVYAGRDVVFSVRNDQRYRLTLVAPKELEGPLAAGTRVGTATVTRGATTLATLPVSLRSAVPAPPISAVLLDLLTRLMPLILILAIAFMIGLVLLRRRRERRTQAETAQVRRDAAGEQTGIGETSSL